MAREQARASSGAAGDETALGRAVTTLRRRSQASDVSSVSSDHQEHGQAAAVGLPGKARKPQMSRIGGSQQQPEQQPEQHPGLLAPAPDVPRRRRSAEVEGSRRWVTEEGGLSLLGEAEAAEQRVAQSSAPQQGKMQRRTSAPTVRARPRMACVLWRRRPTLRSLLAFSRLRCGGGPMMMSGAEKEHQGSRDCRQGAGAAGEPERRRRARRREGAAHDPQPRCGVGGGAVGRQRERARGHTSRPHRRHREHQARGCGGGRWEVTRSQATAAQPAGRILPCEHHVVVGAAGCPQASLQPRCGEGARGQRGRDGACAGAAGAAIGAGHGRGGGGGGLGGGGGGGGGARGGSGAPGGKITAASFARREAEATVAALRRRSAERALASEVDRRALFIPTTGTLNQHAPPLGMGGRKRPPKPQSSQQDYLVPEKGGL
eukprot:SAG25_NODE_119_length_14756_cov_696.499898_6_plen_432_part_00